MDSTHLVSCSFCNVSISLRFLSPGDDGDLIQAIGVISTSTATLFDSLQQTIAQYLAALPSVPQSPPDTPPAPVPPPVSPPVSPPVTLPAPPPVTPPVTVTPVMFVPVLDPAATIVTTSPLLGAMQQLQPSPVAAPETAVPINDTIDETGEATILDPQTAVTAEPPAADIDVVPNGNAANRARAGRRTAAAGATEQPAHELLGVSGTVSLVASPALPIAQPRIAPPVSRAAMAEAELTAAGPTGASSRNPPRAPLSPGVPSRDGPDLGAPSPTQGSGSSPTSPASLLALLVFLVPGFAQWLWARTELRPRALRTGRLERPG